MTTNPREEKGKQIAIKHDLVRIADNHYKVHSQTTNKEYKVVMINDKWVCNCPDHIFRHVCCKHIHAVEFSIKLREEVEGKNKVVISPIAITTCLFCKSDNLIRFGIRHNKSGNIQRFSCQDCHKTFSMNIGFEGMKSNPKAITSAMQLYFTGESLRGVQKFLRLQGVNISHVTIYKWIRRYTKLMNGYLDTIVPQVGDTWRADELYLKVKGNAKYLYALMDSDTRFWIAQQVSDNKFNDDISEMFRNGKEITGKKPSIIITDGARNFQDAWKREYKQKNFLDKKTEHIRHIHFDGDKNNNKMERLNGEIRDREKVVRGLKKKDSPLLKGYQLYHNYVRPHMALDGKTPADKAGIEIQGDNKWLTLIQNASKKYLYSTK